jgi:hypothetical protein
VSRALLALALGAAVAGCNCGGSKTRTDGGAPADSGQPPDGGGGDGGCGTPLSGAGTNLAQGLDTPRRLALSEGNLYVSASGSLNQPNGQIWKVPTAGGVSAPIASGFTAPDAIAVDPGGAYVLDANGLWQLLADGGQRFLDGARNEAIFGNTEIALTPDAVIYATGATELRTVPRDGGTGGLLYAGPAGSTINSVKTDGGWAWFLLSNAPDAGGLYVVALDGSSDAGLVSAAPQAGLSLALLGEDFLWTDAMGLSLLTASGVSTPLANSLDSPARPLLLAQTAYFTQRTTSVSPAFLQGVSLCLPGATAAPLGPPGVGATEVVTDGISLYFTSAQQGALGYVGRLP